MSLAYHDFDTPIGTLRLVGGDGGIERIDLPNVAARVPDPGWSERRRPPAGPLREAKRQLLEYFDGERRDFDLPIAPAGTAFQRRVWDELRRIPYGETVSYGELARRIGRPTASRAVGAANGRNPLAIVVPCHRVIGADGALTGYGGGLPVKETLLAHEQGIAGGGALNGRHARKPQAEGMGHFPGRKPPIQTRAATPR